MAKKNVLIIGGGFAGIAFLNKTWRNKEIVLTLFDQNQTTFFSPLLPDVISNTVSKQNISFDLVDYCRKKNINFINQKITAIDHKQSFIVSTTGQKYYYDYLVLASGAETNFRGDQMIINNSLKLATADDALLIKEKALNSTIENIVISGGGYTGVEIATNVYKLLKEHQLRKNVVLVEYAKSILNSLPVSLQEYVRQDLNAMGIKCLTADQIMEINNGEIILKSKTAYKNSLLIWAAGITTAEYIKTLNFEKDTLGRLFVNEQMMLNNNIFVLGDCANFKYKEKVLRPSVRFAITEASTAAQNLVNLIKNKPLKHYKPLDLGYIVPLGNGRGSGYALGLKIQGRLAITMHYLLSVWFSASWKNRLGLILNLIFKIK